VGKLQVSGGKNRMPLWSGTFTCFGFQVILCALIRQVMFVALRWVFHKELYPLNFCTNVCVFSCFSP